MSSEKPLSELLDELEAYCAKVVPPEWTVPDENKARIPHHRYLYVGFVADGDGFSVEVVPTTVGDIPMAQFVASARRDLPRLVRELRERVERERPCIWTPIEEGDVYETRCGEMFQFESGGPAENKMKFCGYCGAVLKESSNE